MEIELQKHFGKGLAYSKEPNSGFHHSVYNINSKQIPYREFIRQKLQVDLGLPGMDSKSKYRVLAFFRVKTMTQKKRLKRWNSDFSPILLHTTKHLLHAE